MGGRRIDVNWFSYSRGMPDLKWKSRFPKIKYHVFSNILYGCLRSKKTALSLPDKNR